MGCVIALLALSFPRIALLAIWLLGNGWLQESYQTALWPVLGFLLMPWTALAYAVAWHMGAGAIQGPGIILLIVFVPMLFIILWYAQGCCRPKQVVPT